MAWKWKLMQIVWNFQRDHRIVGLAADIARNILFWSDISPEYGGIYCSDLNGNNIVKIIDGKKNNVVRKLQKFEPTVPFILNAAY